MWNFFAPNLLEIYAKFTRSPLTVPSFLQVFFKFLTVFSNKLICFSMFLYHFLQFFSTNFVPTSHQLYATLQKLNFRAKIKSDSPKHPKHPF